MYWRMCVCLYTVFTQSQFFVLDDLLIVYFVLWQYLKQYLEQPFKITKLYIMHKYLPGPANKSYKSLYEGIPHQISEILHRYILHSQNRFLHVLLHALHACVLQALHAPRPTMYRHVSSSSSSSSSSTLHALHPLHPAVYWLASSSSIQARKTLTSSGSI